MSFLPDDPLEGTLDLLGEIADDPVLRRTQIPETLVLEENGDVSRRYTTDGAGIQVSILSRKWTPNEIVEHFASGNASDIVCSFCCLLPRGKTSLEYFTAEGLRVFLENTSHPKGLLQKFEALREHHQVIQVIWTPFLSVVEKRASLVRLDDEEASVEERTTTRKGFGGSREVPVAAATKSALEKWCRRLHHAMLKYRGLSATRVSFYFAAAKPNPSLLFCSSACTTEVSPPPEQSKSAPQQLFAPPDRQNEEKESADVTFIPRRAPSSEVTTPSPSPAGSAAGDETPVGLEVLHYEATGKWLEEPVEAALLVYVPPRTEDAPDSYLVVPPNGGKGSTFTNAGTTPNPAQQKQLNAVRRGIEAAKAAPKISASTTARSGACLKVMDRQPQSNGVHSLRRKYMRAAQAALLQGTASKSVALLTADADIIPKPSRKHIVVDKTVVGAATAPTLSTRPTTAPGSTLFSVLQDIQEAGTSYPVSYRELEADRPTTQELMSAAKAVEARRGRAQREKLSLAPPGIDGLVPQQSKASRSPGVPRPVTAVQLAKQQSREVMLGREKGWDPSTSAEGSMLHLPKQRRQWLHMSDTPRGGLGSSSGVSASKPPGPPPPPPPALSPTSLASTFPNAIPQTAPSSPLPRKPVTGVGDYHQSLSEVRLRQQNRQRGEGLLEALFTSSEAGEGEGVEEAEAAAQKGEEMRRLSIERHALAQRAQRLESLRSKRLKMQRMREDAKLRSQFAALEGKYHNEAAEVFAEDSLYRAYSEALGVRAAPKMFSFSLPEELYRSHPAVHHLLIGLGFYFASSSPSLTVPSADEPSSGALVPVASLPPPGTCSYSVPNDKVLISNMMNELATYRAQVKCVFDQQDKEVVRRLQELVDPPHQQEPVPLYHAVKVLYSEFDLKMPQQQDYESDPFFE